MSIAIAADGHEVQLPEYMDRQARLIGKYTSQLLNTGPERGLLSGEDWKHLDRMSGGGLGQREAMHELSRNEIVSYLVKNWIRRYGSLFGALARIDEEPIERVEAEVGSFQHRVVESIGALRYHWSDKTRQNLPLHTAIEQVRWNGPKVIINYESAQGEEMLQETDPFLGVDALLPHVVQNKNGGCDLLFDNEHISPEILRLPIRAEMMEAIEKDLVNYK